MDKSVEVPFYFTKAPSTLVESGATVAYPPQTQDYPYEMEPGDLIFLTTAKRSPA